jgi:hypothetical protein
VFCDEINLPANDKYGTQRVISFIRQLTEQGGFWRTSDHTWITLERIQFVGACNPPTDAGRVPLSHRFLRYHFGFSFFSSSLIALFFCCCCCGGVILIDCAGTRRSCSWTSRRRLR